MQRVHRRAVTHGADADPDRPGVIMQDVELLAVLVGRHGMGDLVPGVADELLGWDRPSGGTSRAPVSDPGGANRVTWWPRSVSPSANGDTTHSMPP